MSYTVKRLVVGKLDTNCYIIKQDDSRKAVVIDPGDDPIYIKSELLEMNAYPALILLTHGHFDHILAVDMLRTEKTKVCIHEYDADMLTTRDMFTSYIKDDPRPLQSPDRVFTVNERVVSEDGFDFEVLHTPGHTRGSVCYQFGDMLFTGDTLFCGGCGRVDFPGGDATAMMRSLKKLGSIPGDLDIFPGHDRVSTLSDERVHNVYMRRAMEK